MPQTSCLTSSFICKTAYPFWSFRVMERTSGMGVAGACRNQIRVEWSRFTITILPQQATRCSIQFYSWFQTVCIFSLRRATWIAPSLSYYRGRREFCNRPSNTGIIEKNKKVILLLLHSQYTHRLLSIVIKDIKCCTLQ